MHINRLAQKAEQGEAGGLGRLGVEARLCARQASLRPALTTLRVAASAERGPAAPRHRAFFLKAEEPPLCVLARPGIKLFGRDRISARDLLGAYLAGRDSSEDSHLSAGRPPHISICVWKTIGPLRIVGHVSPNQYHWSRHTRLFHQDIQAGEIFHVRSPLLLAEPILSAAREIRRRLPPGSLPRLVAIG